MNMSFFIFYCQVNIIIDIKKCQPVNSHPSLIGIIHKNVLSVEASNKGFCFKKFGLIIFRVFRQYPLRSGAAIFVALRAFHLTDFF